MIMSPKRIVFSGSGGQGVITAAILLAEAAVICEGFSATQTQSYGAAARGGATRSDVIIAEGPILYPMVDRANIITCLTQQAYNQYASSSRPGGLVLTDVRNVTTAKKSDARHIELPMYDTVMEKVKKPIVYNILMLGALIGITSIVKPESVAEILKTRIPEDFLDMNYRALDLGMALGSQYRYTV